VGDIIEPMVPVEEKQEATSTHLSITISCAVRRDSKEDHKSQ
jgi:hypothetical protein